MFDSSLRPGEIFFQSEPIGALTNFFCFSAYCSMLNLISTPFVFVFSFFYFPLNYKYETLIMYIQTSPVKYQVIFQETKTLSWRRCIANSCCKTSNKNTERLDYDVLILLMMMNCFCGMVDRRKAFSLISSRDHCQRSSPSQISDTPLARFEPGQNMQYWQPLHHGALKFSFLVLSLDIPF